MIDIKKLDGWPDSYDEKILRTQIALAEQQERTADALERIADALESVIIKPGESFTNTNAVHVASEEN